MYCDLLYIKRQFSTVIPVELTFDSSGRPLPEATQTVQELQHPGSELPLTPSRELEIRSLKSEIDLLKKQIAGQ